MLQPTMPAPRLWSRQEYERAIDLGLFSPDERLELIEGVIVRKMAQKGPHAVGTGLVGEILQAIFASQNCHIRVQMPIALSDSSEPEPDVAVVSGQRRDYVSGHPTSALLLVEVAETSLDYDRTTKASMYAAAGVADYWILNVADRVLEVYREPSAMAEQPCGFHYRSITRHPAGQCVSPIAAASASVAVSDLLP